MTDGEMAEAAKIKEERKKAKEEKKKVQAQAPKAAPGGQQA